MRVLIGCEESGVIREAFRARGHNAYSCDVAPARDGSPYHLQMDLNMVLFYPQRVLGGMPRWMLDREWDLLIAHPPCTYLCNASVWAFSRTPPNPSPGVLYGAARHAALHTASQFFVSLMTCSIPKVALENPVMHGYTGIGPATQYVQPYQFGDDASKKTGLWLKGLPKLVLPSTDQWVAPRMVDGRPRWGNQTDSGQNKLTPSATRARDRAQTYPGIARAMAEQWG